MNRKQRRALNKQMKKGATEEMSNKLSQFNSLPDMCLACEKPFDKKDKEMVTTWSVVVRNDNTVRLYCPDCWGLANSIIEDFAKEINNNASK